MEDLKIAEGICREIGDWLGVEIVDVAVVPGNRGWILRVTIDKRGGVTINDCATFSHQLDPRLDAENCFADQSYTLEVSSPGLERPLKKIEDYRRFQGKKIKIKTSYEIEGQRVLRGTLRGEQEGVIRLYQNGREIEVPFEAIKKANLEFEWK